MSNPPFNSPYAKCCTNYDESKCYLDETKELTPEYLTNTYGQITNIVHFYEGLYLIYTNSEAVLDITVNEQWLREPGTGGGEMCHEENKWVERDRDEENTWANPKFRKITRIIVVRPPETFDVLCAKLAKKKRDEDLNDIAKYATSLVEPTMRETSEKLYDYFKDKRMVKKFVKKLYERQWKFDTIEDAQSPSESFEWDEPFEDAVLFRFRKGPFDRCEYEIKNGKVV